MSSRSDTTSNRSPFKNGVYEKGEQVWDKNGNAQRVKEESTGVLAITYNGQPGTESFPLDLKKRLRGCALQYIELVNPFLPDSYPMYAIKDDEYNRQKVRDAASDTGYRIKISRGEGNAEFHFLPQRTVGTINIIDK